jgi:hypothetical protein
MFALSKLTRRPDFPSREDLAYAEASGEPIDDLRWYQVLALWKSAIFLEGSYRRFTEGASTDPYFASLGDGVPGLARTALEWSRESSWGLPTEDATEHGPGRFSGFSPRSNSALTSTSTSVGHQIDCEAGATDLAVSDGDEKGLYLHDRPRPCVHHYGSRCQGRNSACPIKPSASFSSLQRIRAPASVSAVASS